jgi:hypothetical protein
LPGNTDSNINGLDDHSATPSNSGIFSTNSGIFSAESVVSSGIHISAAAEFRSAMGVGTVGCDEGSSVNFLGR